MDCNSCCSVGVGLQHEPSNEQLKEALAHVEQRLKQEESDYPRFPNPFSDPNALDKLRAHPKTRAFVDDPSFTNTFHLLQQNPNLLQSVLSDQRIMTALGVLVGLDSNGNSAHASRSNEDDNGREAADGKSGKEQVKLPQSEAETEKEKGNEAYRKRDFQTAMAHYDRAIELQPGNMTFRTNKAAVLFEQGNYLECVAECEKAIETGREQRADFKLIAKALARIANAYLKLNDLQNAKRYFERSVAEHRDRSVVLKLQEVERSIKEKERLAYIDPAKAEEEKQTGNTLFQEGESLFSK